MFLADLLVLILPPEPLRFYHLFQVLQIVPFLCFYFPQLFFATLGLNLIFLHSHFLAFQIPYFCKLKFIFMYVFYTIKFHNGLLSKYFPFKKFVNSFISNRYFSSFSERTFFSSSEYSCSSSIID